MKRFFYLSILLFFTLIPLVSFAQAETVSEKESRLRAELAQVEKELVATEKVLVAQQGESASISRDISILTTKIKAAQLNIKAKNLQIETLGKDINTKQAKILDLQGHISRGQETLSQILRKTNEVDSTSFAEFLLSRQNLSEAFMDVDNFVSVQESLKITFENLRNNKTQTEAEKNTLSTKKNQEQDALATIQTEKKNIENNEKEKKRLLAVSKGNEATYAQELARKKAKASEIRAALFSLAGGSAAIPFGTALKYAQEAQRATGIRPAFLLAIITQESNLGQNVGQCYLSDLTSGNGIGKNTGTAFEQVMKAPRDTVPFLAITRALGRDWKSTPVSCPIGGTKYFIGRGFGGAMGPAQFIASTWVLFQNRIARALGISNPDPWNPEHAFTASALYLTDLGATNGSYTGEVKAACSYFGSGGSGCAYGSQVRLKADNIQRNMIDPLQGL
jgi:peptidoglycan hydrolase CwlO-like protein